MTEVGPPLLHSPPLELAVELVVVALSEFVVELAIVALPVAVAPMPFAAAVLLELVAL